jgi:putative FmdB family regulatory protein
MPIYQYACRSCQRRFDRLVMGQTRPECPTCGSDDLDRLLSVFAVSHGAGSAPGRAPGGACGTCGDPRGPGACSRQ